MDAPVRVPEFMEDVFVNFNAFFPPEAARYLQQSFFAHLRSWVVGSLNFPKGLTAIESLIVRLLTSPVSELRKQTLEMLSTDRVFLIQGSALLLFALGAMERGLSEVPRGIAVKGRA
jgi:hypothetical protein